MKKLGGLADLENKSPEDALRDLVLAVLDGKLAKAEAAKSKKGVK